MTPFRFRFTLFVAFSVIPCPLAVSGTAPRVEPARDAAEWLRWLIPLPKEVSIEQQVALPAADVRVTSADGAGELERNAARRLRSLFQQKAGADADAGDGFEILLGVCDAQGRIGGLPVPDAARLGNDAPDVGQRQTLQTHMNRLTLAGALNVEALRDWERAVMVGAGLSRFREGVQATEDTADAVARALAPFGIRNPTGLVMGRKIGGWELDDFHEQGS